MKQNAGITTTSVIIYIIAMMIVIGMIGTITSFFYTNVNDLENSSDYISEITKFHMYFLEETTNEQNEIYEISNHSILFTTGNAFTFQDNQIYFNHIKICEHVADLQFTTETLNNKTVVRVLIEIGENGEYIKTTDYVLASTM